jgi:hypothetical protein
VQPEIQLEQPLSFAPFNELSQHLLVILIVGASLTTRQQYTNTGFGPPLSSL